MTTRASCAAQQAGHDGRGENKARRATRGSSNGVGGREKQKTALREDPTEWGGCEQPWKSGPKRLSGPKTPKVYFGVSMTERVGHVTVPARHVIRDCDF